MTAKLLVPVCLASLESSSGRVYSHALLCLHYLGPVCWPAVRRVSLQHCIKQHLAPLALLGKDTLTAMAACQSLQGQTYQQWCLLPSPQHEAR